MANLIAFLNVFCSYLLLFGVIVVLAVGAVFIGIRLRKNKELKDAGRQKTASDNL